MAGEANPKPVKEDDDEDVPIASSLSRVVKEESKVEGNDDDDDDDHVPLAQNRANKKKPTNPNKGNIMKKGEAKYNAKPSKAKNEEDDGDGDDFKESMNKKGVVKSNAKPSRVTKEAPKDSEEDDEDDFKVTKKKVKKRKKEETKKVVERKKGKKKGLVANGKKEKKVFDLPGQKHDPPQERDPLRIFYESLYQQLPNSEMAAIWMMEWGLLPVDEAKKVYANKLKNRQIKPGSPVKVVSVKKTATSSVKKVTVTNSKDSAKSLKKRKADSSDDDFVSSKKNAKKQKVSS